MKIEIDIDSEESTRSLTLREKLSIYILLLIFRLIIPAKYGHQVNSALEPIADALKLK